MPVWPEEVSMTRTKKMVSLGVVLLAVVAATSAGAATAWKFITVRKQQVAVFTPGG
jgi:hypothetical protein